jgi:hypothetical protein
MNELVCAHRDSKLVNNEMLDGIGPSMDVPCKSLRNGNENEI